MFPEKELEAHSKWKWWTIGLSILAFIMLIFSFFAPKYLVQSSKSDALDFSGTGQIGDTIGGIMNPFVAIAGVILTFLAFWIQFQANKLQYKQNVNNREKDLAEKKNENDENLKDHLKLVHFDLKEIIRVLKSNLPLIKEYYEIENSKPLQTNILKRTAESGNIKKVLEINRLIVFKAYQRFLSDQAAQLFGNYQQTLEYLSSSFNHMFSIVANHANNKYEELLEVQALIKKNIDSASDILSKKKEDLITREVEEILNNLIDRYYEVIEESLDEFGNAKEQTNIKKIGEYALFNFLQSSLDLKRDKYEKYDHRLDKMENLCSDFRKLIYKIEQDSFKVALDVKALHDLVLSGIVNIQDSSQSKEALLKILIDIEKKTKSVLE
ncbi:MAG: hypothetical protein NXI00_02875 [Cytophagales bacterium]|nr:hypothetical protein [Cytophagales bacterium]